MDNGQIGGRNISRDELFALIWEKPATEVARELGVSDVALGKLCRRLQVPKPPRGYWARVRAGRTPRRPPLAAFRAESERGRKAQPTRSNMAGLTAIQRQFVSCALAELTEKGVDTSECVLSYNGIRAITPELTSQILLLIQNRYHQWIDEGRVAVNYSGGVRQSLAALVNKLLPLAKEQVLVLRHENRARSSDGEPIIIIRLTPNLQKQLSSLVHLVRTHELSHIATRLIPSDYAWAVHHLYSPDSYLNCQSTLCVSANELWVEGFRASWLDEARREVFFTERITLDQVIPIDFLTGRDVVLQASLPRHVVRPYRSRLKALQEADRLYNMLAESSYEISGAIPDERLAIADRIWFGGEGPFLAARNAWENLEAELERWEWALETERQELSRRLLKIEIGDIVVIPSRGRMVRIRVDSSTLYAGDSDVLFVINGTRFRKDGTLGKRQESFYLKLED